MRRSVAWALALALSLGGLAACGDDDGGGGGGDAGAAGGSTTAPAAPTTTPADLAAEVDAFCAVTEEMETVARGMSSGPVTPEARADGQEQLNALAGEVFQKKMGLDPAVGRMDPADAARYEECSAILGDVQGAPS